MMLGSGGPLIHFNRQGLGLQHRSSSHLIDDLESPARTRSEALRHHAPDDIIQSSLISLPSPHVRTQLGRERLLLSVLFSLSTPCQRRQEWKGGQARFLSLKWLGTRSSLVMGT